MEEYVLAHAVSAMETVAPDSSRKVVPKMEIRIRDLRLRTYIGFNPEEMEKRQDVVLNIAIDYQPGAGVRGDRIEAALDYKTITKEVIALVENGRFLLLEKMVTDVLDVCTGHEGVERASVTIDKPHALRFSDSVSLSASVSRKPSAAAEHKS